MKKKNLIGAVSVFGLLMFVGIGSASAFDLAFDGFCDGMTINVGADLSTSGNYTGCRSSAVSGNVNYSLMPTVGLAITSSPNETTEVGPGWVYVINVTPGPTWALYSNGGLIDSGTWSPGFPGAGAGAGAGATGE